MLFEGPQSNEFVRSGQCKPSLTLAPNATCTVDVGFTASASGLRSAQLVVVASDGRRSSITVKGTERKLQNGNGWTDWNMSWDEYVKGSAIPYEPAG